MADEAPTAAPSAPTATTPAAPADGLTPPAAAPAPAQPEAISTEDAAGQIDKIDSWENLESLLTGKPSAIEGEKPGEPSSAPAPTPAPAAGPTAAAPAPPAAPAPVAPEPGDENEVIADAGEKLPKNFRIHTEDKQRSRFLKLLRQRPEANPADLAIEAGYAPAQNRTAAAAPAAPQPPTVHPDVVRLQAEIADLTKKKTDAKNTYEYGQVDDLAEQITDKKLELQRLEDNIEAEQAFEQEYRGEYQSARQEAVSKYPDTVTKGTPQFDELVRERAFLEQTEPGFFDDPGYPLALLVRLEKRRPDLFKGATQAPPAPAPAVPAIVQSPPNAVPPNKAARPVGVVAAGTEGSTQPLGKEEATKAIENMSLEELTALGDAVGTKPKGANRGRVPGVIRG